jgi:hypothetical protein
MADIELRNESHRTFTDISSEEVRSYLLATGQKMDILRPQWLSISSTGHHYIVALSGDVFCVAPGWMALSWLPIEGAPHFVA